MKRSAFLSVALVLALSACSGDDKLLTFKPTGNAAADLKTINSDVVSDVTDFNQKAAAFNAGLVTDAIAVGQAACPLLANADAAYRSALGQVVVQVGTTAVNAAVGAAAATPVGVAAEDATEAVVYADVQKACGVVATAAKADATSPTAAEVVAVQALVADVPKLQQAIAKVSPSAAALLAPTN